MARDTYLRKVLGDDVVDELRSTKVLLVGAGGIGCELLKDLVLTGYGEIHIVDLDTITLSNLNRQFLFRKKDIDKSKATTVAAAAEAFNYLNSKLVPHHGNIMDTSLFPIEWWSQFTFIHNALDNVEARLYLNKMSLFTKKPWINSGTEGFDGTVHPIYPFYSECYDCLPRSKTQKTYPVCTIRSTPSEPIHCITWAKEFLFLQLFDENDSIDLNDINQIKSETNDEKQIENLGKELNELADLRSKLLGKDDFEVIFNQFANKIYKDDIDRLLKIDTLWRTRSKPTPLNFENYKGELEQLLNENNEQIFGNETETWSVVENIYVLYKSTKALRDRLKSGEIKFITFDKDDEDTLNFVASASNLRSHVFGIELKSKFVIKELAGNIVAAIATSNAIVSGIQCLSGIQHYQKTSDLNSSDFTQGVQNKKYIFLKNMASKLISFSSIHEPMLNCPSCGHARGLLKIGVEKSQNSTLRWFIDSLVEKYGLDQEFISIQVDKMKLIYDIDFEDYLDTKLNEIPSFQNNEIILIQDDSDTLENLELCLNIDQNDPNTIMFPDLKLRKKYIAPIVEESNVSDYKFEDTEVYDPVVISIDEEEDNQIKPPDKLEVEEDVILLESEPEEVNEEPPTKKRKI